MNKQFKNVTIRYTVFAVAITLLAACGSIGHNEKGGSKTDQPTTEQEQAEGESVTASGISFKDENGETVSLNSLKGKVVFINFWATWCPPCIHEMPSINELRKSFKGNDGIAFLMVDVDNKIEQSTAFMNKNNYDLPVYTAVGDIPPDYLGGAIPTTVVLDKKGEMVGRMEGGRDYTDPQIVGALNKLVNE